MASRNFNGELKVGYNAGPPVSGTSGTFAGELDIDGGLLFDSSNYVLYVNEGSVASPYWTPVGFDQDPLFGVHADFRDNVGLAISDTSGGAILAGSGLRVYGQGAADTDSGLVVQTAAEGGIEARMTTTNEAAHLLAIGMSAGVMQPDQHGQLVVDVELSNVTAITDRFLFIGFLGTAADALDPPVTIATTVATLVQDDLAGLAVDSAAGDADALYGVHNKSNANATMTAGVLSPLTDLAAAGTYQRFRVEIAADGDMTCFVDKVQVYNQAIALDVDEECSPVALLGSNAAAIKSADVRRFSTWAYRA